MEAKSSVSFGSIEAKAGEKPLLMMKVVLKHSDNSF